LSSIGRPFFKPVWFDDIVGIILAEAAWTEVEELIVDSYRVVAPRRLLSRLD
jgi:hypothetical protein